jgi:hypothetical protein
MPARSSGAKHPSSSIIDIIPQPIATSTALQVPPFIQSL